jgi:hypothetical protein
MNFNYQKICRELLQNFGGRTKDVIESRFGLEGGERKTLEAIGKNYNITRERVRQIEETAICEIKPKLKRHQKVFQYFEEVLLFFGKFRREDKFIHALAGSPEFQNPAFFLLSLKPHFKRVPQNDDFHSLWTIDLNSFVLAKEVISLFCQKLAEKKAPASLEELKLPPEHAWAKLDKEVASRWLNSTVEISRKIETGFSGLFGFKEWPEINPKNIRDKIYLLLKREKRPLHFRVLTDLINKSFKKPAICQTVHNELIRDSRFVLVGRGIYALKEWGYEKGYVRDIILKVLKGSEKPLAKEEILEKVLSQRMVKKSTVLFNLWNKKYFSKDSEGKYRPLINAC